MTTQTEKTELESLRAENARLREALTALEAIHPATGNEPLLQDLLDAARAALKVHP